VTVRTSETLDRLINGKFCIFYTVGTLEYKQTQTLLSYGTTRKQQQH